MKLQTGYMCYYAPTAPRTNTMNIRSRRPKISTPPQITLTPLIDTALTLLIIFMVTTPMIHNAIKVNLPKGRVKEDMGSTQELTVYIDKDEKLYLNGTPLQQYDLIVELKRMVGTSQDKIIYVNADRVVAYGTVTELVDQMKCIEGIAHVALSTQKA